jgi:hypothetical protein
VRDRSAGASSSRQTCSKAASNSASSLFAQCQAGGGGVAAEAQQQVGVALGDQVQRVAQVQAGNRAAGALQFAGVAAREGKGRAMQLFLDAAGQDADHALVPAGIEQRQAGAVAGVERRPAAVRRPRACRLRCRAARG